MEQCRSIISTAVLLCGFCFPIGVDAQEGPITDSSTEQPLSEERKIEPRKIPCFEEIDKKRSKQLEDEAFASLSQTDQAWLTEDVAYIIQPEERCAFLKLESDDEREQFVEQFWLRRSSNPDDPDNYFKEEHYRRIVFANDKFGTETPGWQSDRGQVYVLLGPPDTIDSHSSGEPKGSPTEKGPETVQYSWEKWHYNYLEGMGKNIDLEFVDPKGSGDYQLTIPVEGRDSLLFPRNFGWVDWKDYQPAKITLTSGIELAIRDVPGLRHTSNLGI